MNSTEKWMPVVGYEGIYEVSNLGSVRSLDRFDGRGHWLRGKTLSPVVVGAGYLAVSLYGVGKAARRRYVHRLVLESFISPCPDGMEACHNDGDKHNNRLGNLRWDSHSENHLDIVRSGEHWQQQKTHCPRGHALEVPNLLASELRRGGRSCLSCNRSRDRRGSPRKEIADQIYREISSR